MKKITLMSLFLLITTGCTTVIQKPVEKVDIEPILVGIPFGERIATSSKKINEQIDLLNKINAQKYVGKYNMVTHNNGLDARKGSDQTIPKSFAKAVETKAVETKAVETKAVETKAVETKAVETKAVETKIKKIEWVNDSANKLGKMLANALGYEFVASKDKDINISLLVENENIYSAINKYKLSLEKHADVVIIDKYKTFSVLYK